MRETKAQPVNFSFHCQPTTFQSDHQGKQDGCSCIYRSTCSRWSASSWRAIISLLPVVLCRQVGAASRKCIKANRQESRGTSGSSSRLLNYLHLIIPSKSLAVYLCPCIIEEFPQAQARSAQAISGHALESRFVNSVENSGSQEWLAIHWGDSLLIFGFCGDW